MLDITKKSENGKMYISLTGQLDTRAAPGFGEELELFELTGFDEMLDIASD